MAPGGAAPPTPVAPLRHAERSLPDGVASNSRNCPICGESGHAALRLTGYDHGDWKLGCCRNCRFVFLLNPPDTEESVDELAFERTFMTRKAQRKSALRNPAARVRAFLARFRGHRSDPPTRFLSSGNVPDVGCGAGQRIQPPAVPCGIEISRHPFGIADRNMRARGGYRVHASGSEGTAGLGEHHFDGVLMHSHPGHEVDVLPVPRGAHRCPEPDGRLFLRVPNCASVNRRVFGRKWCGFRYPDHADHFTPESSGNTAAGASFRVRILNRLRRNFISIN